MTVHCVECFFSQYVILPVTCHTNANPFQRLQLLIVDYWFTDEGGLIVTKTSELVWKSLGKCVSKMNMWFQLTMRVCFVIAGLHLQAPGVPVDGAGTFEWIVLLFYKWCPALCPSVTVHKHHSSITKCICIHVCRHCHTPTSFGCFTPPFKCSCFVVTRVSMGLCSRFGQAQM